jgi:hypothetical protein
MLARYFIDKLIQKYGDKVKDYIHPLAYQGRYNTYREFLESNGFREKELIIYAPLGYLIEYENWYYKGYNPKRDWNKIVSSRIARLEGNVITAFYDERAEISPDIIIPVMKLFILFLPDNEAYLEIIEYIEKPNEQKLGIRIKMYWDGIATFEEEEDAT